ncbi:uncharacterized protein LOC132561814 [Ylistrum balloti]|uniref:uncharacterized protein LOC132561814 n=1 Tax=Ylistrum balloti TaxID=509963 RepID=UPI002905D914|nr:uncharacterized protein LOC132561814 [Ylistrum balloti]
MANYMGHDITVHRSFYRLPEDTLQVAKMGKLLWSFDNGTIGKYSGKSLNDITIEDIEQSTVHESDDNTDSDDMDDEQDESNEPEPETMERLQEIRQKRENTPADRKIQRLTEEQTTTLRKNFQSNITFRRELKRFECEKAISKHLCLKDLSWKKVKNTVHNWIVGEKRKTASLLKKK